MNLIKKIPTKTSAHIIAIFNLGCNNIRRSVYYLGKLPPGGETACWQTVNKILTYCGGMFFFKMCLSGGCLMMVFIVCVYVY